MDHLSTTEWILIGGFAGVLYMLEKLRGLLSDIHAEVMNIESHVSPSVPDDPFPPISN